jgi:hypothetical protein
MGHLLVALLVSLAPAAAADGAAAPAQATPPPAAPAPAAAPSPAAHPDPAHLDELLARARSLRLWEDAGWLRLGHYRRKRTGGWESEVDGMAFFRALRGKTDPRAELEATLRGLFDDRPVADELSDAMCRFPARFAFLAGRLGVDLARLPPRRCPRLETFLDRIRPRSATLVFSSYYLNNPASAFGHTFLRLNKDDVARAGREWELLDYGIDYAATVDTGNAVLYAFKGLLGFFKGEFHHVAYYYKVREYADAESRDLFEYELALTPGEVAMLSAHLWELGGTHFDYWYLDENCSYHILDALEAAAPRLSLLEHVGRYVVIPADTVKALFRNPGLVRAVHYRPSIRTQFIARLDRLDGAGRDAVEALSADANAPLPPSLGKEGQAAVLDAALDHLDLRFSRKLAIGSVPEQARARQLLLERRSALGVVSPPLAIPPPPRRAPELGHGSARMAAGGGYSTREGGLVTVDVRLAIHDLGDPPDGYPPLSQIEFLPGRLRFAPREVRGEVDELWAVRMAVLNDLSRFELRPSWRARFGVTTVRDAGCDACLAGQVEFGAGFAKTLGPLDLYAGSDVAVEGASHLEGIRGSPGRLGIGPGGTVRLRIAPTVIVVGEGRWRWLPDARPRETFDLRATLRIHLTAALSLSLDGRRTPAEDQGTLALQAFY